MRPLAPISGFARAALGILFFAVFFAAFFARFFVAMPTPLLRLIRRRV